MYTSLDNVYLEKVKKIGVRAPWINVISEADVEQVQPESLPVKDIKPKKSSGPAISYDDICNKVINSDPQLKKLADEWVAKKIPLLPTTTETNSIPQHYQPLWKELYNISPPKAGEIEGSSKGSGNGELALYWFLKPSNPSIQDNRTAEAGAADLIIKGDGKDIGIEVKSYNTSRILKIGKFSKNDTPDQKNNNLCLDTIFGLDTLFSTSNSKSNATKSGNLSNFNFKNTKNACLSLLKITELITDTALANYNIFENIKDKIKQVFEYLNFKTVKASEENAGILANRLLYRLLIEKLTVKPGDGGFFVNVDNIGNIKWLKVDFEKIENKFKKPDNEYVHARYSELYLDTALLSD